MADPREEDLENQVPNPENEVKEDQPVTPENLEENEVPAPEELLDLSDDEFEKIPEPVTGKQTPADEATSSEEERPQRRQSAKQAKEPDSSGSTAEITVTSDDKLKIYDTLFSSFKANGRDMQVNTPEEALRLMQMGAGHIKYQTKVRPALAIEQTLKNNKIDQQKLNFLIDCANGNPEAIKKLVRDAKIEPYDIDTTEDSRIADANYRPTNHLVSDKDLQLTEVIGTVQGTTDGDTVLRVIRAEWDDDSRTKLVTDPEILNILVDQKKIGVYDQITSEVERRRALGTLAKNVPWLDAYYQVGTDMEKTGAFSSGKETTRSPGSETVSNPNKSKVIETAAAKRKPANGRDPSGVAPLRGTTPVTPKMDASILDMSDDDFNKMSAKFG